MVSILSSSTIFVYFGGSQSDAMTTTEWNDRLLPYCEQIFSGFSAIH